MCSCQTLFQALNSANFFQTQLPPFKASKNTQQEHTMSKKKKKI
jgi:hypothetical protein